MLSVISLALLLFLIMDPFGNMIAVNSILSGFNTRQRTIIQLGKQQRRHHEARHPQGANPQGEQNAFDGRKEAGVQFKVSSLPRRRDKKCAAR